MEAEMSRRRFAFPSDYLGELADCNASLGDVDALPGQMERDGYVLLRGFADREAVLDIRRLIVEQIGAEGWLAPGSDPMDARIDPRRSGAPSVDARLPAIARFYDEPPFLPFFECYFGAPAMRYPRVLTRIKATGGRTGIHCDNVYIGRGSEQVLSCWMPWGDTEVAQGPLAICAGSHDRPEFERLRRTYGRHDPDRDRIKGADNAPGHFSFDLLEVTERFGGRWLTTNFRAGDVLVFPAFTLHCALENTTDRYRISSDIRFQPAADPVDERFMSVAQPERLLRHRYRIADDAVASLTMAEARARWGLERKLRDRT